MIQRFDVGPRLSEMAIHNGVVYLAGQVAEDATQGIAGQTQQVLAEIDALLARAGSDKAKILRAEIFLKDLQGPWTRPGMASTPCHAATACPCASQCDIQRHIAISASVL